MSLLIKESPFAFKKMRRKNGRRKNRRVGKQGPYIKGMVCVHARKALISFCSAAIHQRPSQLDCHTLTEWHVSFIKGARAWENSYDKAWESSFPLIHDTHTYNPSLSFFHSLTHTIPSHLFAVLLPKNESVIFLSSTHQLAVLFLFLSFTFFQSFHCVFFSKAVLQ